MILLVLTLSRFASVPNTSTLMRHERAWCVAGFNQSSTAEGQEAYGQLLWCLQSVEICPLHKVALPTSRSACHRAHFGRSVLCHGPVSVTDAGSGSALHGVSQERVVAPDYRIGLRRSFGKLLGVAPDTRRVEKENIQKVLASIPRLILRTKRNCRRGYRSLSASSFPQRCNNR